MSESAYRVRAMEATDVAVVMEIERQAYPFPWSDGIFNDCIRSGYYAVVLETDDRVRAYGVMSSGAGEAHVLNVCVHPAERGRGLGRELLHLMEAEALRRKADMLLLEVRPSNTVAINLYESMGFNEIGLRKNYYPAAGGREDALVMARQLSFGGVE